MVPDLFSQVVSGRVSLGCFVRAIGSQYSTILRWFHTHLSSLIGWRRGMSIPKHLLFWWFRCTRKIAWWLDPQLGQSRIYHACWIGSGEIPPKGPKERGRWNRHQEPPWYSFPYGPMDFFFCQTLTCNAKLLPHCQKWDCILQPWKNPYFLATLKFPTCCFISLSWATWFLRSRFILWTCYSPWFEYHWTNGKPESKSLIFSEHINLQSYTFIIQS